MTNTDDNRSTEDRIIADGLAAAVVAFVAALWLVLAVLWVALSIYLAGYVRGYEMHEPAPPPAATSTSTPPVGAR